MPWRICGVAFAALWSVVLAQEDSREATLDTLTTTGVEIAAIIERRLGAVGPASRDTLAPALAAWIANFRDEAIELGVEEIPAEIREALSGFVPAEVLEDVRWRIENETQATAYGLFQLGDLRAVTLDHVILFADAGEAADATLWAHELHHVLQYRQWGIEGFVARYLTDHHAIEHEAREFRWRWMKTTGRVPST